MMLLPKPNQCFRHFHYSSRNIPLLFHRYGNTAPAPQQHGDGSIQQHLSVSYTNTGALGGCLRDTHLPRLFGNGRILNFSIYFIGVNPSVIAVESEKTEWVPTKFSHQDQQQEYLFSSSDMRESYCWGRITSVLHAMRS